MPSAAPILNKKILFIIICLPAVAAFLPAQESPWYEGLFVEVSTPLHFPPPLLKDYINPGFGFRGALGYEYNRFRFAIESGYSHFAGTGSLITKLGFAPLIFKFGYALPLSSIFDLPSDLPIGIQADVNTGFTFSQTVLYPTEADRARNNIQEDRTSSFVLGGRLYATITPVEYLRVYAGGGIDVILENEGPLPMAVLEIGVHFKPFVLTRKKPEPQIEPVIEEPVIEEPKVIISLPNIRFQADSAELSDSEKLKLQEIAGILRDIPGVKIQVEGHTARAGTEGRRVVFSLERAQAVASYLVSLEAVDASDVTVVGHGAERPIEDNATEEGRSANRRVEIIILEDQDGEVEIIIWEK
jgi:outer membrane protein OmpA-like peptidoglycan-associated protein